MNKVKLFNVILGCILLFVACNESNSLKPVNAEKVIREFVTTHQVLRQQLKLNPEQIIRIEKPNVYSQFYSNVKVSVLDSSQQTWTLLFDFKRSPQNKWVLQKIEPANKNEELKQQVIVHKNLSVPTQ